MMALRGGKGRVEGPIEGESLGDGDVLEGSDVEGKGRGEGPIEGLDDGDGLEDWVALGFINTSLQIIQNTWY